ncbi:MAG: hypothetical protein CSB34_01855 [Desulfobulbus propionicus]|nr:MAG: hypothetical protein CSB34_01855 [Desulfobulbus propionicus]
MKFISRTYSILIVAFTLMAMTAASSSRAEDGVPIWDSVVNSLLATGMYGIDDESDQGLRTSLTHSSDLYSFLTPDDQTIHSQAITLSYVGSSGLLGFSAGYLYTGLSTDNQPERFFLGFDPYTLEGVSKKRSWFMALDLSKAYQYDEDVVFRFSSSSMLHEHPLENEAGKTFSMLFNMPITYKNTVTITPEFQWLRTSKKQNASLQDILDKDESQDSFYGGLSISFSY